MDTKINNKVNKVLLLLLGLIITGLLALIFIMSSQNGAQSQGLSRSIVRYFRNHIPIAGALQHNPVFFQANFNIFLRKLVHFTEFFVLAGVLYFFLTQMKFKRWKIPNTVLTAAFCFASLDEFHQFFVRGRTALFTDVIVDFAGAALAVFIIHSVKRAKEKKRLVPPMA